jgi:GH15 family glucan-1,4-alpha-glucosidase
VAGRIEDYALIGDLQTAALVGRDGSIDWLCLPRFDSAACFAALLGGTDNGRWRLAPVNAAQCAERSYRGDTLVLDTYWDTPTGRVRVTDFMPQRDRAPDVVRIVEGLAAAPTTTGWRSPGRTRCGCAASRRCRPPGGTCGRTPTSPCPRARRSPSC